jgi:CRISPR/Cas system-associated exonuclease Cas4 (RecB family)
MAELFTKTDYKNFLECSCYLWMERKGKHLMPPPSASGLFHEQEGEKVDELAKRLFKDGVELPHFGEEGWRESKELFDKKTKVIFQPTVVTQSGLTCRADIVTYDPTADAYDIREVKSATKVRPEDLHDVAFQLVCFEEAGIKVGKTYLIHVNNAYVRKGDIDPAKLFITEDVTDEVRELVPDVTKGIADARAILAIDDYPDNRVILSCKSKTGSCEFLETYLSQASAKKLDVKNWPPAFSISLLQKGVLDVKSLSSVFLQGLGYKPVAKTVDAAAIKKELATLVYPIYFLDYETFASPIPPFDGTRPWQKIVFQYSLHLKQSPDAKIEQKEFLAVKDENPIPAMVAQLKKDIGTKGSVIVWYASFEVPRNKEIGEYYPEYAEFMDAVNSRVYDLMVIFKKKLYVDAKFYGSASIKAVLPIMVPELSYKELAIQEGGTASVTWPQLIDSKSYPAVLPRGYLGLHLRMVEWPHGRHPKQSQRLRRPLPHRFSREIPQSSPR